MRITNPPPPSISLKSIRKTANEVISNSGVQDDDELVCGIEAGETWKIELLLLYAAASSADLAVIPSLPAGCSAYIHSAYKDPGGAIAIVATSGVVELQGGGVASVQLAKMTWIVFNGATAGNFQIRWGQVTPEVSNATVFANSLLSCQKVYP